MNRATQLRKEIRDAWSHMEIPVLPPPVTTECFEFPFTMFVGAGDDSVLARTGFADYRYTHDAVSGMTWDAINLGPNGELHEKWTECWLKNVPSPIARVYYYASFLDYVVKYYEEYQRDAVLREVPYADFPFMCAISFSEHLLNNGDWRSMTRRQLRVTLAVLEFARAHWPAYGFLQEGAWDDEDRKFNRNLKQSLESSIVRLKRIVQSLDAESAAAE